MVDLIQKLPVRPPWSLAGAMVWLHLGYKQQRRGVFAFTGQTLSTSKTGQSNLRFGGLDRCGPTV